VDVTQEVHRSTGGQYELVSVRGARMSIGSVMARIGEIQSRFGVTTGSGSAAVSSSDFAGFGSDELIELATEKARELAGDSVADSLQASLLDALSVRSADAGLGTFASETLPPFDGTARYPVPGFGVGSTFGPRIDPIEGDHRVHRGVDIGAPSGTPILAAGGGTVTWAGPRGTYGNLVIVEHDDRTETRYAHQSEVGVELGDVVQKGDVIGSVGSTGKSTGPHLHFETRVDGVAVDPVVWLREHDSEETRND
jgi:murein DD-endopeptidase MepM/ murein hydrolase activator NlpD